MIEDSYQFVIGTEFDSSAGKDKGFSRVDIFSPIELSKCNESQL